MLFLLYRIVVLVGVREEREKACLFVQRGFAV